ncbi:ATP-binding protein [Candidatus Aerophobetes bacterium]|uniref:ATP-binding protein n=1 Tax=Aerophobetes bacterium TaxID=2030807 RepID=A0A523UN17_UNCAE|nr:MAG: ATP-binding protein [Candidatus Aerophobetes bacterium]
MNNEETLSKMQKMKLYGMLRAFNQSLEAGMMNKVTADELLGHLIDAEWDERHNRRLQRLIKAAKFRYQASLEEIDFKLDRGLDKNMLLRFSSSSWIEKKRDIIITGPTGVGKSFLASSLGYQGCMYGFRVLYFNCSKLFSQLKLKKADGTYNKELDRIQKQEVLILDDFGLHPFDAQSRLSLLEIMEDRHGRGSTVISSQFPVKSWHEIIGEPTIADAICDRIIHSAYRIELKGESVRKKYAEKLT